MNVTVDFSKGVALTLMPKSRNEEITQSIFILLNTIKGSIPFYREFGLDNSFAHKPAAAAQSLYASAVADAIERFLPDIHVNNISFANDSDEPSTLCPKLEVTIIE